jgi:hypothetical protein
MGYEQKKQLTITYIIIKTHRNALPRTKLNYVKANDDKAPSDI